VGSFFSACLAVHTEDPADGPHMLGAAPLTRKFRRRGTLTVGGPSPEAFRVVEGSTGPFSGVWEQVAFRQVSGSRLRARRVTGVGLRTRRGIGQSCAEGGSRLCKGRGHRRHPGAQVRSRSWRTDLPMGGVRSWNVCVTANHGGRELRRHNLRCPQRRRWRKDPSTPVHVLGCSPEQARRLFHGRPVTPGEAEAIAERSYPYLLRDELRLQLRISGRGRS
jgi:hypothetical protein